jgi:hypothetical protein
LDLVLVEAPYTLRNARSTVEPGDDGRAVTLEAVDRVRCCGSILPGLLDVRVLLPEERLFLGTKAVPCPISVSVSLPLALEAPLPSLDYKVPNPAILGKAGLELARPPQRALCMQRWLLLVGFRHVTLHRLGSPS